MTAKAFWRWVAGIAIVVLALSVAGALVVAVSQSPQRGVALVEVLKLFISWPAIVGLLCLCFGIAFRKEFGSFIEHIGAIRFAGAEVVRQAPTPEATGPAKTPPPPPDEESIALTPEQQKAISDEVAQLFKDFQEAKARAGQAEDFAKQVQEALNAKQQQAVWWWFQYLGLFLVPNSKFVLHWLSTRTTRVTREWFHEEWKARVPSAREREIILSALLHHELLLENGSLLTVSEAGHAFLDFLRQQGFWLPS